MVKLVQVPVWDLCPLLQRNENVCAEDAQRKHMKRQQRQQGRNTFTAHDGSPLSESGEGNGAGVRNGQRGRAPDPDYGAGLLVAELEVASHRPRNLFRMVAENFRQIFRGTAG